MDTRGWALFQKGKYDEAKKWFEKAIQSNEKDFIYQEHMGDVLSKLKEFPNGSLQALALRFLCVLWSG